MGLSAVSHASSVVTGGVSTAATIATKTAGTAKGAAVAAAHKIDPVVSRSSGTGLPWSG